MLERAHYSSFISSFVLLMFLHHWKHRRRCTRQRVFALWTSACISLDWARRSVTRSDTACSPLAPSTLFPFHLIPFLNVRRPPSTFFFTLSPIHPLLCHMLSCSSKAITWLTAAIRKYTIPEQPFKFKGIQGRLLCIPFPFVGGGCSLHACTFVLQVSTLCRWSISTCRGSSATTSSRPTSLS